MKVLLTLITIALTCLQGFTAQDSVKYQGLLWKISGNGLEKPSYLYGTMHVSSKLAFNLGDSFFNAIKNSDIIALEMNPEKYIDDLLENNFLDNLNNMMSAYYRTNDNMYEQIFSLKIPEYNEYASLIAEDNKLNNPILYRYSGFQDDFEESTYLDLFIYQTGKKMNKGVFGLETLEQVTELTKKAYIASSKEENKRSYRYPGSRNMHEELEQAYRKGNLDKIHQITCEMYSSKSYVNYIIYLRNEGMAKKMDSLMQLHSVFTGVGAAHLPGEKGIINILREKGYTVNSMHQDIFGMGHKMRNKIDKLKYKVDFQKHFTEDSLFSVEVPGKLYSTPTGLIKYKSYLCTDLVNGAFYNIKRMNTFAPLIGRNQDQIAAKIDSMLYENIPGKIVVKRSQSKNQTHQFEITNKTKRSDYQQYHIYVNPLETITFKVGGKDKYAKTGYGKHFFNSIVFNTSDNHQWETYEPSHGEFSIEIPANYIVNKQEGNNNSPGLMIQAMDPNDSSYYLIMRSSYHDYMYIEEDTFEISILAENTCETFDFDIIEKKTGTRESYPCLTALAINKDSNRFMHIKTIIRDANYYLLASVTNQKKLPEKFINSFHLKKYKYKENFEKYVDTNLYFTVLTTKQPKNNDLFNSFNPYLGYNRDDEDQSFKYDSKEHVVSAGEIPQSIKVDYIKYHKFNQIDSIKEYFSKILKYEKRAGLTVKDSSVVLQDSIFSLEYYLTDTNSIRIIRKKNIIFNGLRYIIAANYDTITGESKFISTFFETFVPATDTLIGTNVLINKADLFFQSIDSDSAMFEHAKQSVSEVDFKDEHAPHIISVLDTSKHLRGDLEFRRDLILALESLKHDNIVPYLSRMYKQTGDTSTLQFAILETLAGQQTKEASILFKDLIIQNPPLSSSVYDIKSLFYPFYDSLELATHLFPELMELILYPEYKGQVFNSLSQLLDSSYIEHGIIEPYKNKLIREAKYNIKRHLYAKEKEEISEYGYSSWSRSESNEILNLASILSKYYHDEPAVKEIFKKLQNSPDDDVKLSSNILAIKHDLPVNDTIWSYFSSNDEFRINLYTSLVNINRTDLFDSTYATPMDFTRAQAVKYNFDFEEDSILFYKKEHVQINDTLEGWLYFYKIKEENRMDWFLSYVGLQPPDTSDFDPNYIIKESTEYSRKEYNILEHSEEEIFEEIIDDAIKDLRYWRRQRADASGGYLGRSALYDEPSHDKFFDTHGDDY